MRRIWLVSALFVANAAAAQTLAPTPAVPPRTNGAVTTIAPTGNNPPEAIAPADRAGNNTSDPAGPVASTPFSAGPQGGISTHIDPTTRGTIGTPNLGK